MAEILRAIGGIFDGVNQAVCSVFHLVGATGRLSSAFVNGVIKAVQDCGFAVSMIGTSLWAASLDILCYIADFFLEVFHVFYGCLKVISKIGLLLYMLCGALMQFLSISLKWSLKILTAASRQCYEGLAYFGLMFKDSWHDFKAVLFNASQATVEQARTVGNQTLTASHKAAETAVDFFAVVSNGVADQILEFYGAASHFVNSCLQSFTTYTADVYHQFILSLQELSSLFTLPQTTISQDLKERLQDYFPNVELTFYDLLVILLIPSGTIFLLRFMVNYLNRKGMTFPLIERPPRPARIRPRFRPQYFVESSDEDLDYGQDTDTYGHDTDYYRRLEEEEELVERGYADQDPDAVFAAGEVDHVTDPNGDHIEYEESNYDYDENGDAYSSYDDEYDEDNSEVEEFEVATDSEESESDDGVQIKVELPQTGGYNLRERPTSEDPIFRQQLSPEELEKILENERDRRMCVVCTDQPKTVVVLPCKHMCMCVDCAHELVRQRSTRRVCPLCRSRFNTVMHIYA